MKSILIPFFLFLMIINPIYAEDNTMTGNKGFCQKAETTVDLMDCIGTHYEAEAEHMNTVYQSLITAQPSDNNSDFRNAIESNQQDWIAYRDALCAIEGSIYEGGSLARVQQLDCMSRVTADRSDHFKEMMAAFNADDIPVFASPPRWKNVLLNNYPDTYWAMGSPTAIDTDCDGVDENIVKGVNFNLETSQSETVLAIADSPVTGRPTITMLNPEWGETCAREPLNFNVEADSQACSKMQQSDKTDCNGYVLNYNEIDEKYTFSLPADDIQKQTEEMITPDE